MSIALVKKDYIELQKLHEVSYHAIRSTSNFLDNLLHWSLTQIDRFFYQKENLHLKSILEQVLYDFKFEIKSKKITLNCTISEAAFIYADLNTIKIVLRNLIDNAIKYSHSQGIINIITQLAGNKYELIIEDFGIGIDKTTLKHLLKTNHIIKGKHTNKLSTGLGIQLSKTLLSNNNATLHIESNNPKGTKIIISFVFNPPNKNVRNTDFTH